MAPKVSTHASKRLPVVRSHRHSRHRVGTLPAQRNAEERTIGLGSDRPQPGCCAARIRWTLEVDAPGGTLPIWLERLDRFRTHY